MKDLFEKWIVKQFGKSIKPRLEMFHDEDGYADQDINMIWIGFNAGVELSPLVP